MMELNWDAIGAIGEMVGACAVVASLLYLSLQTKASVKAMRIQAVWDAETAFASVNYEFAHNPGITHILTRAFSPDANAADFTEGELAQVHFALRGMLQHMQAQWSLWGEGYLSDELWERRRQFTGNLIRLPIFRSMWDLEFSQFMMSQEFKEHIELVLDDTPISVQLLK